ncbi:MAG: hypothetical protein ACI95C_002629 [Pseudohongiellaceae bacterium]|jgi:uncharacterized protein (TIGR02466 family)
MTAIMQDYDKLPALKVEAAHLGFFESPVVYSRLADADQLLADLETAIRHNMANSKGLDRSNVGGWHSDTDMLQWGGSAARKLADTAIKICKRVSHFNDSHVDNFHWTAKMWANVTPNGGLNQAHAHPGNLWAAVLYLDLGEDPTATSDVGGTFYIEDPRFPMAAMHNPGFRLLGANGQPQQYETEFNLQRGNLIVFPAWLKHGVRRYLGNRERISIAMNIEATPKQ